MSQAGGTPNGARLVVPIRLTDVRIDIRFRAAQQLARREPTERIPFLMAAICPSDTTYYLSESARPLIERYAA